jgi:hypothetical protein
MQFHSVQLAAASVGLILAVSVAVRDSAEPQLIANPPNIRMRDAYTSVVGGNNSEGEVSCNLQQMTSITAFTNMFYPGP